MQCVILHRQNHNTMQVTIKQKPLGYFRLNPYLVFIDGELAGKVHRFRPLTIHVDKDEFYLTIKDYFLHSTRHCKVKDSDTILFEAIDNFPFCMYLLYCLLILLLTFLHINLFLPDRAIIASLFLFPAFIGVFDIINRKNYFVIENVERAFNYADGKLVVFLSDGKPRLIDFKDIAYFHCENNATVIIMKNGERIQRTGTLAELEDRIPPELRFRVNRQMIVLLDSILCYNDSALCVQVDGKEKVLPYFSTKQGEVLAALKAWNPELYSTEVFKEAHPERGDMQLSDDLKRILDYLNENPGAGVQQVAKDLHFSIRTAHRRMAVLRKMKLL